MEDNTYAYNHAFQEIHISHAKSGRQGYYCLGCRKEMQAVKQSNEERRSYFRHDPKDVDHINKCTYRDETYRHKLAKEILQRLKYIKVPSVFKYPPPKVEGGRNLLEKSKIIEAFRVEIEKSFYEDESGQIQFGSNLGIDERFLLIRPDVTFFDQNNKPILFIELVSTHKPDFNKQAKLRRLGINAIEVSIPKDAPEKIEAVFSETSHTKWIYNELEATTQYIPVPTAFGEGVLPFDVLERQLYEESFKCRAAQVGNLIRALEKCLESESYRSIERGFRNELSRVKENSERNRQGLESIENELRADVFNRFKSETEQIGREEEAISVEERELRRTEENLDERYTRKKAEIDGLTRKNEDDFNRENQISGGEGKSFERLKGEIESEEGSLDEAIQSVKSKIDSTIKRGSEAPAEFRRKEEDFIRGIILSKDEEIRLITGIEQRRTDLPEHFARKREELEVRIKGEFESIRRESISQIERRSFEGHSELSGRINKLFQIWELLRNFENHKSEWRQSKSLLESLEKGTYKNW